MFKRWAWRLLRPIVELKIAAFLQRLGARFHLSPENLEAFRVELMVELDKALGFKP